MWIDRKEDYWSKPNMAWLGFKSSRAMGIKRESESEDRRIKSHTIEWPMLDLYITFKALKTFKLHTC